MRRLLVFGDSVPWGQGLRDEHKFANLLADRFGLKPQICAHSGAIIGLRSSLTRQADGEIPISWPTVAQQIAAVPPADDVSVVLLNGGINDVDIRTIFNPCTDEGDLEESIEQYCGLDFSVVLTATLDRFPAATVLVTGYYPILSEYTDWSAVSPFLLSAGLGSAWPVPTPSLIAKLVQLSLFFWRKSEQVLAAAVARVSPEGRARFVSTGFTEDNAIFAGDPLLFGLTPLSFDPEDEVVDQRRAACALYYKQPQDVFSLFQCIHASAGHPNVQGAQAIYATLAQVLAH